MRKSRWGNLPKVTQLIKLVKQVSSPSSLTQNTTYLITVPLRLSTRCVCVYVCLYMCNICVYLSHMLHTLRSNRIPTKGGRKGPISLWWDCSEIHGLSIAKWAYFCFMMSLFLLGWEKWKLNILYWPRSGGWWKGILQWERQARYIGRAVLSVMGLYTDTGYHCETKISWIPIIIYSSCLRI